MGRERRVYGGGPGTRYTNKNEGNICCTELDTFSILNTAHLKYVRSECYQMLLLLKCLLL